jgi:hypothetical protein
VVALDLIMYAFDGLLLISFNKESRMHDAEAGPFPFLKKCTQRPCIINMLVLACNSIGRPC